MSFYDSDRPAKRQRLESCSVQGFTNSEILAIQVDHCNEDDPQERERLQQEQWRSRTRFRHRMEDIFQRYSVDREGEADEINIRTGAIEVDRGHWKTLPDAMDDEEDYESFTSDEDGIIDDHDEDILDFLQTSQRNVPDWSETMRHGSRASTPCLWSPADDLKPLVPLDAIDLPSEETILRQFGSAGPAVLDVLKKQARDRAETPSPVARMSEPPTSMRSKFDENEEDDLSVLTKDAFEFKTPLRIQRHHLISTPNRPSSISRSSMPPPSTIPRSASSLVSRSEYKARRSTATSKVLQTEGLAKTERRIGPLEERLTMSSRSSLAVTLKNRPDSPLKRPVASPENVRRTADAIKTFDAVLSPTRSTTTKDQAPPQYMLSNSKSKLRISSVTIACEPSDADSCEVRIDKNTQSIDDRRIPSATSTAKFYKKANEAKENQTESQSHRECLDPEPLPEAQTAKSASALSSRPPRLKLILRNTATPALPKSPASSNSRSEASKEYPNKCPTCSKFFNSSTSLQHHQVRNTCKVATTRFACPALECHHTYLKLTTLKYHLDGRCKHTTQSYEDYMRTRRRSTSAELDLQDNHTRRRRRGRTSNVIADEDRVCAGSKSKDASSTTATVDVPMIKANIVREPGKERGRVLNYMAEPRVTRLSTGALTERPSYRIKSLEQYVKEDLRSESGLNRAISASSPIANQLPTTARGETCNSKIGHPAGLAAKENGSEFASPGDLRKQAIFGATEILEEVDEKVIHGWQKLDKGTRDDSHSCSSEQSYHSGSDMDQIRPEKAQIAQSDNLVQATRPRRLRKLSEKAMSTSFQELVDAQDVGVLSSTMGRQSMEVPDSDVDQSSPPTMPEPPSLQDSSSFRKPTTPYNITQTPRHRAKSLTPSVLRHGRYPITPVGQYILPGSNSESKVNEQVRITNCRGSRCGAPLCFDCNDDDISLVYAK